MYLKYTSGTAIPSGVFGLAILLLSYSMPSFAVTPSLADIQPGVYCPGNNIKLIIAEELTASLDLAMRSRAAMFDKDQATALNALAALGTTLNLAASRGAGARTAELIDAIIRSSSGENYKQMLDWLPLLYTSLQPLQNEAAGQTAKQLIEQAEQVMAGEKEGKPLQLLKQSQHMLSCDRLSIPIEQALADQFILVSKMRRGQVSKITDYDALLDSLRNALQYALARP